MQSPPTDARTTTYEYDAFGNQTKTIFADNTFISAAYDDFGRKLSETNQLGQIRTFEYDAQGNQTLIRDPLGHETRFTYDAQGR